jgi:hypothetical protein
VRRFLSYICFDALVALALLERRDSRYSNTAETDLLLDRAQAILRRGVARARERPGYRADATPPVALIREVAAEMDSLGQGAIRAPQYPSAYTQC